MLQCSGRWVWSEKAGQLKPRGLLAPDHPFTDLTRTKAIPGWKQW